MAYICYCYIVAPATKIPMGGIGVFWILSTAAQVFAKYDVWYGATGSLSISLPCADMVKMGSVEQVFPNILILEQLITVFRVGIEVWVGTSNDGGALDLYHRILVAGAVIYPRWAKWRLTDVGTDPVNWIHARRCLFVSTFDLMLSVANQRARL